MLGLWPVVPPVAGFWVKSISLPILDFEFGISDLRVFFSIRIPQLHWPARSMKWKPLHGFCPEGPCPRAWQGSFSAAKAQYPSL